MSYSPAQIYRQLSAAIGEGRWSELGAFYAADAIVELPQAPMPDSTMHGRDAVAASFASMGPAVAWKARDLVIYDTTDPEVVVAEFAYDGHGATPFTSANVQILRIRDNEIVHSRDYHDFFRMAAAFGGAEASTPAAPPAPALPTTPPVSISAPEGTPRGTIERLLVGVANRTNVAELYAETARVIQPFSAESLVLVGRDAIEAHFDAAPKLEMQAYDLVTHDGVDPEIIIAEFTYSAAAPQAFAASNVVIARIQDGLIVESHEYLDHFAFAMAAGLVAPPT